MDIALTYATYAPSLTGCCTHTTALYTLASVFGSITDTCCDPDDTDTDPHSKHILFGSTVYPVPVAIAETGFVPV